MLGDLLKDGNTLRTIPTEKSSLTLTAVICNKFIQMIRGGDSFFKEEFKKIERSFNVCPLERCAVIEGDLFSCFCFFLRRSSSAFSLHLWLPRHTCSSPLLGQCLMGRTHTVLEKKTKTKGFSAALHMFSTGNSSCQRPCDA